MLWLGCVNVGGVVGLPHLHSLLFVGTPPAFGSPSRCAASRSYTLAAIFSNVARTSFNVRNQCAFRHSSRKRP